MSRTKGSKNKPKHDFLSLSNKNEGNPAFNIKDVAPSETIGKNIAPGAILPEDLELERSLQSMVSQLPEVSDIDPTIGAVKKVIDQREMLGDVVDDYSPASTMEELREQAHLAIVEGCDSIEVTRELAKKVCRDPQLEAVGYFHYHNIKAYLVGSVQESKKRDSLSIEQRTFGKSTEAERQEALRAQIKVLEKQLSEH
jgi:hypothetical protein